METPYKVSKTATENTEGSKAEAEEHGVLLWGWGHRASAKCRAAAHEGLGRTQHCRTGIQEKLFYTQHYSL